VAAALNTAMKLQFLRKMQEISWLPDKLSDSEE
jgi:hypothetical protein